MKSKLGDYPLPRPDFRSKRTVDIGTKVIRWMDRSAMRHLHALRRAGIPFPDTEALSEWIQAFAKARGLQDAVIDKLTHDEICQKADRAAAFVLDNWDEDRLQHLSAWGRKGGLASKKPKKITLEMLQALPEGLTIAEQAVELECSESTIKRRRADLKEAEKIAADEARTAELLSLPGLAPKVPQETADAPLSTPPGRFDHLLMEPKSSPQTGSAIPSSPTPETSSNSEISNDLLHAFIDEIAASVLDAPSLPEEPSLTWEERLDLVYSGDRC